MENKLLLIMPLMLFYFGAVHDLIIKFQEISVFSPIKQEETLPCCYILIDLTVMKGHSHGIRLQENIHLGRQCVYLMRANSSFERNDRTCFG